MSMLFGLFVVARVWEVGGARTRVREVYPGVPFEGKADEVDVYVVLDSIEVDVVVDPSTVAARG